MEIVLASSESLPGSALNVVRVKANDSKGIVLGKAGEFDENAGSFTHQALVGAIKQYDGIGAIQPFQERINFVRFLLCHGVGFTGLCEDCK